MIGKQYLRPRWRSLQDSLHTGLAPNSEVLRLPRISNLHLDTLLDGKGGNATEGPEVWHEPETVSTIDMQGYRT